MKSQLVVIQCNVRGVTDRLSRSSSSLSVTLRCSNIIRGGSLLWSVVIIISKYSLSHPTVQICRGSRICGTRWTGVSGSASMSQTMWLLFNAKSAIVLLYHKEDQVLLLPLSGRHQTVDYSATFRCAHENKLRKKNVLLHSNRRCPLCTKPPFICIYFFTRSGIQPTILPTLRRLPHRCSYNFVI